ncbi:MAG TPA: metallophosphoesterase [Actinomycetes bacterium]|nr:metallophosphoesterase [Actinomycetes bacterium]
MPAALTRVAVAAAAAAAACVGYGVLVERDWYRLRHERVRALEPGQPPLTVLHLSDLHLTVADTRRVAFLERLAAEQVDLVVMTGDMLGEPAGLDPVLEALSRFRPRLGAVAVLGSNDYWAPRFRNPLGYFLGPSSRRSRSSGRNPWRELVDGLEARGWTVLSNRRGRLADVELAGMDDPHIRRDDPATAVPANGDARPRLRLGVVHSPYRRALDAFAGNGYDLVLAGHTHGGQVRLPGVGALVTNCDLPRDRVRGLSRWGSSWLHVSAGLGTSKYAPFRFACRPEASLLEVVPKA